MVCSLGNGTASRETEAWLRQQLRRAEVAQQVAYAVVDEAGASVTWQCPAVPGCALNDPDSGLQCLTFGGLRVAGLGRVTDPRCF